MKNFALFLLFISLFLPANSHAGTTPIKTIQDIQTALNTANQELFDASIDMESLVGQCIDIIMEDADKEGQQTIPPMLAMILSAAKLSTEAHNALRSNLITEVGEFIRYGVRSGAYAGKNVETTPPGGILAPFLANASMGRKEITRIGEAIPESGAVYVTFVVKDHDNGRLYPVEAWLRASEGNWQVVGLRNVRTLTRMIQEESTQTL